MTTEKNFPNGFTSWQETHYEVVQAIAYIISEAKTSLAVACADGQAGLYELAEDLTDEFEKQYEDHAWDGDFYDTIEAWLNEKLK